MLGALEAISLTYLVFHVSEEQSILESQQVEESHLGVFNVGAIKIVRFTIWAVSPLHLDPIAYEFDEHPFNPLEIIHWHRTGHKSDHGDIEICADILFFLLQISHTYCTMRFFIVWNRQEELSPSLNSLLDDIVRADNRGTETSLICPFVSIYTYKKSVVPVNVSADRGGIWVWLPEHNKSSRTEIQPNLS